MEFTDWFTIEQYKSQNNIYNTMLICLINGYYAVNNTD